jgi:hypothetical protein
MGGSGYINLMCQVEENSMTTSNNVPQMEDVASVGTRISWGAILAGSMVALAMYFLLSTLAVAVGWSIHDRVDPTKLEMAAVVWTFLMTALSLFVGGLITSLFTAGENKMEAMLYGAIMWAVLVVALLHLGSSGVRTGFTAMAASAHTVQTSPAPNSGNEAADVESRRVTREAANRAAWYAFFGTWLSLFAAVAGSVVGAGPTFRLVNQTPGRRVAIN